MENGTFGANVPFFIIFSKNLTFQRSPKVPVWSKGLFIRIIRIYISATLITYFCCLCCSVGSNDGCCSAGDCCQGCDCEFESPMGLKIFLLLTAF